MNSSVPELVAGSRVRDEGEKQVVINRRERARARASRAQRGKRRESTKTSEQRRTTTHTNTSVPSAQFKREKEAEAVASEIHGARLYLFRRCAPADLVCCYFPVEARGEENIKKLAGGMDADARRAEAVTPTARPAAHVIIGPVMRPSIARETTRARFSCLFS